MTSIANIAHPKALLKEYCSLSSRYAWPAYDSDLVPGHLQPIDSVAPSLLSYPIPSNILQQLHAADGNKYAKLWALLNQIVADSRAHTTRFEALPRADLAADKAEGIWNLVLDAWRAVDRCHGLTMVAVTKILHRKLPELIPIRDSRLDAFYGAASTGKLFEAIHDDVRANTQLLDALRQPYSAGARPMSRLRALDIAVWMHQNQATR